ncbi:MAG TPA: 2OG-Fe(II) oxygenase [Sphingomicrobium sp.]|nr:2OG-Fe(II) oxygenase [Sphingomicrobium sp.]
MKQAVPAEGRTDIAAALLLGGSTDEVLRAISLIDAAAEEKDAAALERKALLEAVGCGRSQSWDRALDCLALAAERGSERAQDQLRILGRVPREQRDWGAIRSGISIEKLVQAPQKLAISESPRLRVVKAFASAAESLWLVERARDRLRPATVVTLSGSQTIEGARTNSAIEFQLADMDLVVEAIRARISSATRLPLPLFEPSQVLNYAPGQEFRAHHDYFDLENRGHSEQLRRGQRIATFLVYLNDGYTGGETAFPRAQLSFRGNVGDALFIANVERSGRPDPLTLHAGKPPASGEKWIFSQWIRDRALAGGLQAHSNSG